MILIDPWCYLPIREKYRIYVFGYIIEILKTTERNNNAAKVVSSDRNLSKL